MAGRRKSTGPINYHELPRRRLQSLCKKYGFPANKTNVAMADALNAFLNDPERLASGIESPAISSRSVSYISVDESPVCSPGVDSLPSISESRPGYYNGLRITNLPEILEVDPSSEEVHFSSTVPANGNAVGAVEQVPRSSVVFSTLKSCEGNGTEAQMDNTESTVTVDSCVVLPSKTLSSTLAEVNGVAECSGERVPSSAVVFFLKSSEGNGSDSHIQDSRPTVTVDCKVECVVLPSMTVSSKLAQESGSFETPVEVLNDSVKCRSPETKNHVVSSADITAEVAFESSSTLDNSMTETSETKISGVVDSLVEPEIVDYEEKPSNDNEEMKETFDNERPSLEDHVAKKQLGSQHDAYENVNEKEPLMDKEQTALPDMLPEGPSEFSTTFVDEARHTPFVEEIADDIMGPNTEISSKPLDANICDSLSFTETGAETGPATTCENMASEQLDGNADGGSPTPLPLSVMPSLSTELPDVEAVGQGEDLNSSGYPSCGPTENSSEAVFEMQSLDGSQDFSGSKTLKTRWMQDDFFGFKGMNVAALSPKVRRNLGIDIPKLPMSKLTFPVDTARRTVLETEETSDVVASVTIAGDACTPSEVEGDLNVVSMDFQFEESTHVDTETENKENHEVHQIAPGDISVPDSTIARLETSSSPVLGHVQEIVKLLDDSSSEEKEGKEPAGSSRKDVYKQSPIVRSSRLAADIERAQKLGQAKRAAVLAGRRSSASRQETHLNTEEVGDEEKLSEQITTREEVSFQDDKSTTNTSYGEEAEPTSAEPVTDKNLELEDIYMTEGKASVATVQEEECQSGQSTENEAQPEEVTEVCEDVVTMSEKSTLLELNNDHTETTENMEAVATVPEIKYVEIPRPVETNAEGGPISELSWIRKATNLPTSKAHKPEKIKGPVSANLRKFSLMEKAAQNASKKQKAAAKKARNARTEIPPEDVLPTNDNQPPINDVEIPTKLGSPTSYEILQKSPERIVTPLSLRNSNVEAITTNTSCPATPKASAVISLDEILRETIQSAGKENQWGKDNERMKRHQEEYKTPLTGRSKEKSLRAAELNASLQRDKILKQRRGIEEEELLVNLADPIKSGRLL